MLAARRGPSVGKLEYAASEALDADPAMRELMKRTESMEGADPRQRASALWDIVKEEIKRIDHNNDHPRCRAALRAAFRIPMEEYRGLEYDTIAKRLAQARQAGAFEPNVGQEAPNNSWRQGVRRLGWAVEARLTQLACSPEGWLAYETKPQPPTGLVTADTRPEDAQPEDAQRVFVDRLIATYMMTRRSVGYAITERLVTAKADVDHYVVRAYSPLAGRHEVKIEPLFNCRTGEAETHARAGVETHEVPMYAPAPLQPEEQWHFATRVSLEEDANEEPVVEIQVTSYGIAANGLTMRVQFDPGFFPRTAWWLADVPDGRQLVKPPDGHRRRLECSDLGFLEHTFTGFCKPLGKYGLSWEW